MSRASIESSTPSSRDSTWNGKPAPSTYLHKQLDVTEADAVLYLGLGFSYLFYYSTGGTEKRLLPRTAQKQRNITFSAGVGSVTLLSFLHFVVSYRVSWPPSVRWCLFGFGIFLVVNVGAAVTKKIKTAQKAKQQKVAVPAFTGLE